MNAKQVLFLHKNGLVDPGLVQNWEEKNEAECITASGNLDLAVLVLNLYSFLTLISILFLTVSLSVQNWRWVQAAFFGVIVFSTVLMIGSRSRFARELTQLNELVSSRSSDFIERGPYNLHLDFETIHSVAIHALIKHAVSLINAEIACGIDDPSAKEARKCFKDAHATLIAFGLCEKNQGVYLKKAREHLAAGGNPASAKTDTKEVSA